MIKWKLWFMKTTLVLTEITLEVFLDTSLQAWSCSSWQIRLWLDVKCLKCRLHVSPQIVCEVNVWALVGPLEDRDLKTCLSASHHCCAERWTFTSISGLMNFRAGFLLSFHNDCVTVLWLVLYPDLCHNMPCFLMFQKCSLSLWVTERRLTDTIKWMCSECVG